MEDFKLKDAPNTIYYIPSFITPEEESEILNQVYNVPKPKWTCLSNRRLQDYGGVPHPKGMIPEKIPSWLEKYMRDIDKLGAFEDKSSNHVLINEYLPGQGIMPHTDGPLFYPTVTTISCGSHTVLSFLENTESRDRVCDVILERRSLVVFKDDMYSKFLHTIREVNEDDVEGCVNFENCSEDFKHKKVWNRGIRISLTVRHVPKVCKIKLWK